MAEEKKLISKIRCLSVFFLSSSSSHNKMYIWQFLLWFEIETKMKRCQHTITRNRNVFIVDRSIKLNRKEKLNEKFIFQVINFLLLSKTSIVAINQNIFVSQKKTQTTRLRFLFLRIFQPILTV